MTASGDGDALVIFMPSGRRGRFRVGTPLLDAARSLGVYVESVCGGRGICGRCQIVPSHGIHAKHGVTFAPEHLSTVNDVEERYRRLRSLAPGRRLSCQAKVVGDAVIDVPSDTAVNQQVVRKRAEAREITPDPATRLLTVVLPPADMQLPQGDASRIRAAVAATHGVEAALGDPMVLQALQPALARGRGEVTVAVHADAGAAEIIAIWPGRVERALGIACDIGSTTIACHLVDLLTGRTISSAGTSNPQIRFGEDLMSRVSYVMLNPDGLGALTECVRDAINVLAARVAAFAGASPDDILEAVLVGNPVMHHLLLGIDPTPLGQAPFTLAVSDALEIRARDLGLRLNSCARVYLLPLIAGHVGADAAAVALAEAPQREEATTLIVDIGTNAEIILGNRTRVLAASSPTGPAFEGAQISAGQRAAPGAIERVRIDPATLEPRIRIIGADMWSNEPGFAEAAETLGVTGICGSGIIEALGEMFLAGIIGADGTIDGGLTARSDRVVPDGRTFAYRLWPGPVDIRISQTDVRAIQLAKGALYAGTRLLMDRLGIDRVDRIRLAGAFGSHIDPKYAMIIGLIPDCDLADVSAIGNAAGTGARMALLSRTHRREVEGLVRAIEKVETALEPRFQEHFVAAMAFPHASDPFERLSREVPLPERTSASAARAGRRRDRGRTGRGTGEA